MTPEILAALLRSSLGTGPGPAVDGFAGCDWPLFESLVTHHGLTPVCYEVLQRHDVNVPAAVLQCMRSHRQLASPRNRLIGGMIDDVAAVFAAEQTPAVVLRGAMLLQVLFSDGAQPILPEIELLVAEEDRVVAERQLRTVGFRAADAEPNHSPATFSRYQQVSTPVVLTSRLFELPVYGLFTGNDVRARARPADRLPGVLRVMSPGHELIYLCLVLDADSRPLPADAAQDRREVRQTMPWRELYDLGAYLQQAGRRMNWADVVVEARGRGLAARVAAALRLCEQTLSVAAPAEVLRELAPGDQPDDGLAGLPQASLHEANLKPADPPHGLLDHSGGSTPASYVSARSLAHPDKRPGLRFEPLGEDRIAVCGRDGTSAAHLNRTAAVILELCDGRRSLAEVTEATACLFEVDPAQIDEEVQQAVRSFTERGVVRAVGVSIADARVVFPIVNRHHRWSNRPGNRYCTSRYVDWRHIRQPPEDDALNDILFFTQFDLDHADLYRANRKIAWMREPRPIAWWSYDLVEEHIDEIDSVLTYDADLIRKYPDKCIYCPYGGCHIHPDNFAIHPKNKLVSFIASAKRWRAPGHLARHEFYEMYRPGRGQGFTKHMLQWLDIDLYGPLVDNTIEDKLESLKDYMFQIAIENVISDTYFTEKLIDCFLTGTIPIYRGSRRASEFFDVDGILFYSNTEELFEILRSLTPDEYERRLPHARRNFQLAQRYTHAVDWAYLHTDVFR